MKNIFTVLFLLITPALYAQQVIFGEDFESFPSYQISGWGHIHSGPVPWTTGLPYLVGGLCNNWPGADKIAGIPESCGGINHNNSNVVLITPSLNLTSFTDVWLEYDSYFLGYITAASDTEKATVEVSVDAGVHWDTVQVVPVNPGWSLSRYYVDLTAYQGNNDVRVAFRYNDGGGHARGWEIDNVRILAPAQKDLYLKYVTPRDPLTSYVVLQNSYTHQGEVFNYGLDTITDFTVKYRQDNGPVHQHTFTGLQIPPFTSYSFTHPVPDTVTTPGQHNVTMWVETTGDNTHYNDTAKTRLNGTHFMPKKLLVVEEGTGTWNVWGPRGWTLMNEASLSDLDICQIAVHTLPDPMGVEAYDDFLFYKDYNYVPYMLFDRKKNVEPDSFYLEVQRMKQHFGFADMNMNNGMWGTAISITTTVTPAVNMQGDYRLVLVLTEDSVRGTSSAYDQRNNFTGGAYGPMGGFENKPDPVPAADMFYNFVARKIFPAPDGITNMLPGSMTANNTYSYTFHTYIDPAWDINRVKAFTLLIDNSDSTILNAQQLAWSLGLEEPVASLTHAGVYPNPANDFTRVFFTLDGAERVEWTLCDISGRMVQQQVQRPYAAGKQEIFLQTTDMPPGVYIFTLRSENFRKAMKVQVMH